MFLFSNVDQLPTETIAAVNLKETPSPQKPVKKWSLPKHLNVSLKIDFYFYF